MASANVADLAHDDELELDESPMSDRQRGYRNVYRERIATWYNGYVHVLVIYVIGFSALFVFGSHVSSPTWLDWLVIPVVFLIANFFEWYLHAKILHRPQKFSGFRAMYQRHTLMHHQFFTDSEMRFAGEHDWRVTFFPPYALIIFMMISIPGALLAAWMISANAGWFVMCTTTSVYLIYEFMHFCCHVNDNWFVRNMPLVNTIRRHHEAHHNQSIMMERNMNLTFPISDWFFKTSDLNRGLLGHLFNGYNSDHVKTDMRKTSDNGRVS